VSKLNLIDFLLAYKSGEKAAKNSVQLGITENPADATVAVGENAEFRVSALGENLSYQWQYSADGGTTWADSAEETATAATLRFTASKSYDGYLYRCVVTNASGSMTSPPATLAVYTPLSITSQPVDFVGEIDDTASFTVVAEGDGLTYQWQWLNSSGVWKDQSYASFKVSTLQVQMTESRVGYTYRCRVTDERGNSVNSNAVTMTVAE